MPLRAGLLTRLWLLAITSRNPRVESLLWQRACLVDVAVAFQGRRPSPLDRCSKRLRGGLWDHEMLLTRGLLHAVATRHIIRGHIRPNYHQIKRWWPVVARYASVVGYKQRLLGALISSPGQCVRP